jgi:tRNA pseudouridine38-40 synthase
VTVHGSGRTDAGVHAQGQTASFQTKNLRTPEQILRGVNSLLPKEIAVIRAEEAPPDFQARFQCRGKCYTYDYSSLPVRNPLWIRRAWQTGPQPDWSLAENCLPLFLGTHDFAPFQSRGSEVQSTVRTIVRMTLTEPQPHLIRLSVWGTGFLRHMVRNLAGLLCQAARGQVSEKEIRDIMAGQKRTRSSLRAPACGLCLQKVYYEDWEDFLQALPFRPEPLLEQESLISV